jgi:hypothetical protein
VKNVSENWITLFTNAVCYTASVEISRHHENALTEIQILLLSTQPIMYVNLNLYFTETIYISKLWRVT